MSDYWESESEYDAMAEDLKNALRKSVKDEITKRIEKLETENLELKGKLSNLSELEREALRAKAKYERESSAAKSEALGQVRKEKLVDLLAAIDERLFTVERIGHVREKCDRCDDGRRLHYVTPRGKEAYESCDCAQRDYRWEPVEAAAHEVSRRDGALLIWWLPVTRWADSDALRSKVLESAANAPAEKLRANPSDYSFKDLASAQAAADAANGAT